MPSTHCLPNLEGPAWTYEGQSITDRLIQLASIPAVLDELTASHAQRPALTWIEQGETVLKLDYAALLRRISALRSHLMRRLGLRCGDRVVVISANCPEALIAHTAIMSFGAVTVPVSNSESPRVLSHIVETVVPRLILVGRRVEVDLSQLDPDIRKETLPNLGPDQDGADPGPAKRMSPDAPAAVLFTSGTTSVPRGVCLSHYNLIINAEAVCRVNQLAPNSVQLCVLPLYHANAFGLSMIGSLYSACHLVLCDGLPGPATWQILQRERVNVISLVPELLRFLALRPPEREKVRALHHVVSAAAPLPVSVARIFYNATGVRIQQGYGLSECTNFAATLPPDLPPQDYEALMHAYPVPSIGPTVFGTHVEVLRADGCPAAPGEIGEITVRGHNVMRGYWGNPDATRDAIREGALHTGDLGFFIETRCGPCFFVTGREKEIIIRCGEKISPLSVERELEPLRRLGPYAVAGFANDVVGEEIGLCVALTDTPENRESVREALRACPTAYRPRSVLLDDRPIPVTATGKIKRAELSARFANYSRQTFGTEPLIERVEPATLLQD